MTPESQVKNLVKALLKEYNIISASKAGTITDPPPDGWYFMPTQSGLGVKGIPDFIGHYGSCFFAIETKAPGKKPTGFQALQIEAIRASGGEVFIIDGSEMLKAFEYWLEILSIG